MLEGLHNLPEASAALRFVRCFYNRTSNYLWTDDSNQTHIIEQAEGGEQGDPFMPMLYALGQHPALVDLEQSLQADEKIYAFLDDIYITCQPHRVRVLFDLLCACFWNHSRIRVHHGKTRIWNRGGTAPANCSDLVDSQGRQAWRGDPSLPSHEQGIKILGTPLGHRDFVAAQMQSLHREHEQLLQRIPEVPYLQSAWLLLSFCANARAIYYLRTLSHTGGVGLQVKLF